MPTAALARRLVSRPRRGTDEHPPAWQHIGPWSTAIWAAVRGPLCEIDAATVETNSRAGRKHLRRQPELLGTRQRATREDQQGTRRRRHNLAIGFDVSATTLTDPVRHAPIMDGRLEAEEQVAPRADPDHQFALRCHRCRSSVTLVARSWPSRSPQTTVTHCPTLRPANRSGVGTR